jgi:hypothetical protein
MSIKVDKIIEAKIKRESKKVNKEGKQRRINPRCKEKLRVTAK